MSKRVDLITIILCNSRPPQKICREGDIKVSKHGTFERIHRTYENMIMTKNGRYLWEWVRIGDAPEGFTGRPIITRIAGRRGA